MSFSIPRIAISNYILKKNVTITSTPQNINRINTVIAGSTDIKFLSLTVGGVNIDNTLINNLLLTDNIVPGISSPNKAIVLNNSKNISELGSVYCTNVVINGTTLDPSIFSQVGSTDDASNEFLTSTVLGLVQANKAIVLDNDYSCSGINILSVNSILLNYNFSVKNDYNDEIELNYGNNYVPLINNYLSRDHIQTAMSSPYYVQKTSGSYNDADTLATVASGNYRNPIYVEKFNMYFVPNLATSSTAPIAYSYNGSKWYKPSLINGEPKQYTLSVWSSITNSFTAANSSTSIQFYSFCWSPDLEMFVAGAISTYLFFYSYDGFAWFTYPANNYNYGTVNTICWSSDFNMFVAGTSSANVLYSYDGLSWNIGTYNTYANVLSINKIEYASFCKTFFMGTGNAGTIYKSYDGINWIGVYDRYLESATVTYITVSEELKRILLFTNTPLNNAKSTGVYSDDGINWFYNGNNGGIFALMNTDCVYVPELKIFFNPGQWEGWNYSFDGISWFSYTFTNWKSTSNYVGLFSKVYSKFIIFCNTSGNTDYSIVYFNPILTTNRYGFSGVLTNNANNSMGIGAKPESIYPLSLGSDTGKFLKFTSGNSTLVSTIDCSNNILSINSERVYCWHFVNNNSAGIKLGGELVISNANTINSYLSNLSISNSTPNQLVITDNNNDLSINNTLVTDNLIINENVIDYTDTNILFNSEVGVATEGKVLVTDSENSIYGINSLSSNSLNIEFNKIISSKSNKSINLDKYLYLSKDVANSLNGSYGRSALTTTSSLNSIGFIYPNSTTDTTNLTSYTARPQNGTNVQFISGLGRYYAFTSNIISYGISPSSMINQNYLTSYSGINYNYFQPFNISGINRLVWINETRSLFCLTSSGIFVSHDGGYFKICNMNGTATSPNCLTYSPELNMYIAGYNTGSYKFAMSCDGINWCQIPDTTNINSVVIYDIIWVSSFGMFIACSGVSKYGIMYSYTGLDWYSSTAELQSMGMYNNTSSNSGSTFAYSPKLNALLLLTSNYILISYNGLLWNYAQIAATSIRSLKWYSELDCFLASYISNGSNLYYWSANGVEWNSMPNPLSSTISSIFGVTYSKRDGLLTSTMNSGFIASNTMTNKGSSLYTEILGRNVCYYEIPTRFGVDLINRRIGLGIQSPSYTLELASDSAYKTAGTTWVTSSDERLKENIELADLVICYNNVNNIPLKRYKWKDEVYTDDQINDRNKLGWIAQDVEQYIPKAVSKKNMHGYEDCRDLNNDQIIANMYGCTKYLINMEKISNLNIDNISKDLLEIETFINSI